MTGRGMGPCGSGMAMRNRGNRGTGRRFMANDANISANDNRIDAMENRLSRIETLLEEIAKTNK